MNKFSDHHLRILEKSTVECQDVTDLLGDLVDDELPITLRDRVTSHIGECEQCKLGEQRYREVISLARELKPASLSSLAQRRLREALNKRLGLALPVSSQE